jgi:hypothetical protein
MSSRVSIGGIGAILDFGEDKTTQIYRNLATSDLIFTTVSTKRLVIFANGNVGIGTSFPETKLHVYDDINNTTSLIIHNNNIIYAAPPVIVSTPAANMSGTITGSIDKYMIFTAGTYNFTVPPGGINCDILMIGGGGAGGAGGGGGGAGACIIAIGQTLTASATISVTVGNGGSTGAVAGGSSIITENGNTKYNAMGGGRGATGSDSGNNGGCGGGGGFGDGTPRTGGINVGTNIVNGFSTGPIATTNYVVLGSRGGNQIETNVTIAGAYCTPGGGGIGGAGADHLSGVQAGGVGGPGLNQVTIGAYIYNFKSYFANDGSFGQNNGYIGGGGGGTSLFTTGIASGGLGGGGFGTGSGYTIPISGFDNTGSGGGGRTINGGGSGGSGIVIIRYRSTIPSPSSSSIELLRGITGDTKTDYKIGNYEGDFKIISSTSGINTDRLVINQNGNLGIGTITSTSKLYLYDDITNATKLTLHNNMPANAISSSSIELIRGSITDNNTDYKIGNYDGDFKIISSTSGINTDALVINQSSNITFGGNVTAASFFGDGKLLSGIVQSQWSSSNNSIYYNTSNVGIGTGNPDSKLHMYDDAAIYTNLLIHNNNLGITAITSYPEATVNGIISNSTDKFMIFTTGSYNLTIPIGGIICDILMIGGGGGGGGEFGVSGGGGAGACIVAINQNFEQGMYVVTVGNGSPGNGPTPNLGGDSIISVNNSTMYRAKGGGGSSLSYGSGVSGGCGSGAGYDISYGGYPANTNVVRGVTTGPIVTATYGVYGNKGGDQQQDGDNAAPSSLNRAGGGGIGWPGRNHTNFGLTCGDGGDGAYQVIINGNLYNFRSYFANGGNNFGVNDGNGNYYIGGGGGGGSENVQNGNYTGAGGLGGGSGQQLVNAIANTGSGGSGFSSLGGSGIVIIRYKTKSVNISLNASIELKRGSATDSNTDYKIGNYDGDFKIISSTSGIRTDKLIINQNGNVGIGTNLPSNNLDIYDDVNTNTSLLIQNNNTGMFTTTAATIISSPAATISNTITNSIDKFLILSSGTYTLTVPSGGINCDILMIGGGGGGGFGGGGGAGACIVAINQILTSNNGNYTVVVGAGAVAESTSNGEDSIISVNNTTMYRAKGGGTVSNDLGSDGGCGSGSGFDISSGGNPLNTNVVTGVTTGPIVTATYAVLGSKGGNQLQSFSGNKTGGGGIGGAGYDHIVGGPPSNGGPGLNAVTINNMPYNFKNYFANGGAFGVDGYIGGGGGGGSYIGQPPSSGGIGGGGNGNSFLSAISNTGSGGGSFEADGDFTGGGSGIVIIRYRAIYTIIPTNASIKLARGSANDSKTDYQLGNYDGDFKIITSTSGINTDALVINQNGNVGIGTITPTSKLYLYDDINNTTSLIIQNNIPTNAITSSSIELTRGTSNDNNTDYKIGNYNGDFKIITSTSGINTDAFVINQTSNITINGNIGIGTNSPTNILQVGNGGRLRIANDNTGFTCLGTNDAFGSSNTSIVLSGINRTGAIGNIEYFARSTGIHAFYTGSGISIERLRIASNGNVGIGTVDTAAYKLNVNGSINAASFFGDGNGISGVLLTSNDTNLSNYVLSTSNTLANRITNLVTDNITETINSKNKFIVNDRYNNNLLVNGTLTINSNLVVLGESTRLETIVYTTERLEVINENTTSVALKIQQKDIYTDIFNASNLNSMVFNIANNGDVNISGKYKINNRDIDANISNYVLSTSNILVDRIRTEVGFGSNYSVRLDSNISNYVLSTSNILVDRIRTEVGFGSNYSVRLDSNISNYVLSTSNILVDRIRTEVGFGSNYSVRLDSNISNYVLSTSNILVDRTRTEVGFGSNYSVRLDSNISNYVLSTSNILVTRIRTEVGFGSNYSVRLDSNISNYVLSTSNILVTRTRTELGFGSNYSVMLDSNISNYILSTSNTLIARIGTGGGGSSQWTTYNNMIYYNTSNVGIGTSFPETNLHIFNDATNSSKIIVQNNFPPPLPSEILIAETISTIIGVNRCILFPYSGSSTTKSYTLTTLEPLICDILVVGGGGGGGADRGGGGGGGGIIYLENINLNGVYNINVGKKGLGTTAINGNGVGSRGLNGENSYISGSNLTLITAIGGGGGGGCGPGTNVKNGLDGGSGGGGSQYGGNGSGGIGTIGQGKNGGTGYEAGAGGGGGGYVNPGSNATVSNAGNGGIGLSLSITGSADIYSSGGGGGGSSGSGTSQSQPFGYGGSSGAGNGGNAKNNGVNATGYGCGGGGSGWPYPTLVGTRGGDGGDGVVIIRYRKTPLSSSSFELIRGSSGDANIDYKMGNYVGDFKIKSSTLGIDKDVLVINQNGNVGIGTTIPQMNLHVQNGMRIGGSNAFLNFGDDATMQIYRNTTTNEMIFTTASLPRLEVSANGNVLIGATTESSDDNNATFAIPDAKLYVRDGISAGGTCDVVLRGGNNDGNNGKSRLWLSANNGHSSYIQSEHTGSGNTQLTFGTANGNALPTERMKIWSVGAVGIQNNGYALTNNQMAAGSLTIGNQDQNYGGGTNWTASTAGLLMECADNTEIAVHDAGNSIHSFMQYTTNGLFTIGRNMGYGAATVNFGADINVTGNITAYYSDKRLKTKTRNIQDPLKIINGLEGFYYTPNELAHSVGITNTREEIGLSAQDVQKNLPELISLAPFDLEKDKDGNKVSKSGDNYLTMSYERLIPVLVEAIKELNKEIILFKNENIDLKDKYKKLLEEIISIKHSINI